MTKRVIRKRIRHRSTGLNVDADLNAVIAINSGADDEAGAARSDGARTTARATQSAPIVQRSVRRRRTEEDA